MSPVIYNNSMIPDHAIYDPCSYISHQSIHCCVVANVHRVESSHSLESQTSLGYYWIQPSTDQYWWETGNSRHMLDMSGASLKDLTHMPHQTVRPCVSISSSVTPTLNFYEGWQYIVTHISLPQAVVKTLKLMTHEWNDQQKFANKSWSTQ